MKQRKWVWSALVVTALLALLGAWIGRSGGVKVVDASGAASAEASSELDAASSAVLVSIPPEAPDPRQAASVATAIISSAHEDDAISGIVEDSRGQPVDAARCTLRPGRAPDGMDALIHRPAPSSEVVAETLSRPDGSFRLEAPPGTWILRVEREGMSPWEERGLERGDFRRVRLSPALDLDVMVVDRKGSPIGGAQVALLRGEFHDPRSALDFATTRPDGSARLRSVPNLHGFLHVSHASHIADIRPVHTSRAALSGVTVALASGVRVLGMVELSDGSELPNAARVRFESAEGMFSSHEVETGLDGAFASRTAFHPDLLLEIVALVDGHGEVRKPVLLSEDSHGGELWVDLVVDAIERTAAGVVEAPSGEPLGGVDLYVVPLEALPPLEAIPIPAAAELAEVGVPDLGSSDPIHSLHAVLRHATTTRPDGSFRVTGLRAEMAYMLLVAPERYSNATLWIEEGLPGETANLGTVRLRNGGTVFGSVVAMNGGPLAEAPVSIIQNKFRRPVPGTDYVPERPSSNVGGLDTIANADGSFRFQFVPESSFMLSCEGGIFGPYELADGGTLGPLELVVEAADTGVGIPEFPVVLHVEDGTGIPVPRAFALLTPIAVEGAVEDAGFRDVGKYRYGQSDEYGRVRLQALAGGYDVVVKDLTGVLESERFQLEVDPEESGTFADVRLAVAPEPPLELAGIVTSASGAAVEGLLVTLTPDKEEVLCSCVTLVALTDDQGTFSFGPVLRGEHSLVVTSPESGDAGVPFYPARPGEQIVIALD